LLVAGKFSIKILPTDTLRPTYRKRRPDSFTAPQYAECGNVAIHNYETQRNKFKIKKLPIIIFAKNNSLEVTTFKSLKWQKDRMVLGDLVFRLQHYKDKNWELGDECFMFYKIKKLVDQYEHFFSAQPNVDIKHIFELGTFDGGSSVFWFELLKPDKLVAIDVKKRGDSDYFKKYISANSLENKIKAYWQTNQADKNRLEKIYKENFSSGLDLVIDDASHLYDKTKASFEALFPFLRTGGLYIIEDWAWGHWKEFFEPDHEWANKPVMTKFIFELVEAAGSSASLVRNLAIYEGFMVVEKGDLDLTGNVNFHLDDHINRRPARGYTNRGFHSILKKIKAKLNIT
jgi:predicted O-methyltransferase YrrM